MYIDIQIALYKQNRKWKIFIGSDVTGCQDFFMSTESAAMCSGAEQGTGS